MNKKVIISIIAVILISVLAVIVGKNLVKGNTEPANTNPLSNNTSNPEIGDETPSPEEETSTPDITQTPSPEPTNEATPSVNVSQLNEKQKIEYAKNIAKQTWEKLGVQKKVYYSADAGMDSEGNYIITIREESTTKELARYKINIKTGSSEITY